MNRVAIVIGMVAISGVLTGCGSTLPLIFADKTSVGIDISGSEQGIDFVLGFKTKSVSIIPVAVRRKDKDGNVTEIIPVQAEDGEKRDAYSTFGNFTVDTQGETAAASVGLGRFFATGVAAQNIATELGKAMVEKAKK